MRRLFAFFVVISTLVVPLPSATPAGEAVVTAVALTFVPGGRDVPAQLFVARGSSLAFANADTLGFHRIESIDYRDGEPLFTSGEQIGPGQVSTVRGVEALTPGRYGFVCPIHAGMEGSLTVA